jgi:CRP/FNR family transcriptional regulator, transcriptional activator FtrB
MRAQDRKLLETTQLHMAVGDQAMERLTRNAFVQLVPKDGLLFMQGDMPEFVHLVLSGRISLGAEDSGGHATVVEIFHEGQLFILAAAILSKPYLLTARALSEARVLMIPADTFRATLDSEPRLARALVDVLAGHWRLLVRQIKGLKLHSAAERLATYLVIRSDARDGAATMRLDEELRIVAARLGMTPESLSRAFTALRPHGVTSRGRSISIADIAALRRMCRYEDME